MASSFSGGSRSSESTGTSPFDVDMSFLRMSASAEKMIAVFDALLMIIEESYSQQRLVVHPLEEHVENFLEEFSMVSEWIDQNRMTEKEQEILSHVEEIVDELKTKSDELKELSEAQETLVASVTPTADSVRDPLYQLIGYRNCKLNRGDFISSLSDDTLLSILSELDVKEQARTSVLSSRWTNLWTYTSCLNIDAKDVVQQEADRRTTRLKFENTVDQILGMHRGKVIDQLKLTSPDKHCVFTRKVNGWIEIAKQKQVKALYLDGIRKFSLGSTPFTSLVTLCLKKSFLSNSVIHHILSNTPNLLELSIIKSTLFPDRLSISGSSLKLKHFELVDTYIRVIEISAPNLASFNTFRGTSRPTICLKNIPLLTQLSCSLGFILRTQCDLYPVFPQLETLTLTISNDFIGRNIGNFPMLMNLKHLYVKLLSDNDRQLRVLLGLLRACPYLRKLSFDLGTFTSKRCFIENFPNHKFLEELVIYNFKEFQYEVQLLICIVETCSSLQKVIIHPDSNERKVDQKCWESVLADGKELEVVFKSCITDNF